MSAAKHIDGPWRVVKHSWSEVSIYAGKRGGKRVCSLSITDEATEANQDELTAQMDATATLIASSTHMLEALELIAAYPLTRGDELGPETMRAIARAALKATGSTAC